MDATGTLSGSTMAIVGGTSFANFDGDNDVRIRCVITFLERMDLINRTHRPIGGPTPFPVIIADASPGEVHEQLKDMLEGRGATVLDARENPGIAPQNQAAIRYALLQGATFITRTELEKYGFAELDILNSVVAHLEASGADILCIGRRPGGAYESLPPEQQDSERIMSRAFASLGLPEDTACGLRAMSRHGAELVCQFNTARHGDQWQYLWFCLLDALKLSEMGWVVDGLFVDMIHPPEMTALESRNPVYRLKRANQAAQLIPAVTHYAATLGIFPRWDATRTWII